ncbi:MAG: hypothetical protein NZL99_10495 [Burkholderiaceae bacterium]|nr:hypothetical protein [Burkholderiaceae bacterium]
MRAFLPLLRLAAASTALLLAAGCATLTGDAYQSISIHAVDAQERPLRGLRCRIVNGTTTYFGDTPLLGLRVRRSAADLQIECRHGEQIARATAIARGSIADGALKMLLPGGSAMLAIDHLTGYRYAYASELRVKLGAHLIFDPAVEGGRPFPVAVELR